MSDHFTKSDLEAIVGAAIEKLLGDTTSPTRRAALAAEVGTSAKDRERLALATARGRPDNSQLTERGIRGIFYDALELNAATAWAQQVGLYMPSNTRTEKHRWLGQVPEPRKHFGGLNASPLNDFSLDITNEDYEITVPFSTHDMLWDQVGHLSRRITEIAIAWADHWNKLSVDVLEGSDLAYDGVALFSGSHSIGDSGTLDNDLAAGDVAALNVSNTSRPTKAEAAAILSDLAAYMYRYTDDRGRPHNQGAKRFMLLCHPQALPGFRNAIADELYITGGSNELRNLGQEFAAVAEPRLASTSVVYLFRMDGVSSKPLILQEAKRPSLEIVGPQSEHAIKNNEVLYVSKAIRAAAPGEFRQVIKATLS